GPGWPGSSRHRFGLGLGLTLGLAALARLAGLAGRRRRWWFCAFGGARQIGQEEPGGHNDGQDDRSHGWSLEAVAAPALGRVEAELLEGLELPVGEEGAAGAGLVTNEDSAVPVPGHVEVDRPR